MSNKDVRSHLSSVIEKNNKSIEINNEKIEKLRFIKKSLTKDIKELEVLAYLSLTNGKYGKLQDKLSNKMNEIEKIDIELIKLKENKLFNFLTIRKLEKEKALLEKEVNNISKEFKELKASISPEQLTDEIIKIKETIDEKEHNINKEIKELINENKELNTMNNVCHSLFNDYKDLSPEQKFEKALDLSLGNSKIHNTGNWNLKIEDDKEKVIRL